MHPGLVELALQAVIARVATPCALTALPCFRCMCICGVAAFPACKASSMSLA